MGRTILGVSALYHDAAAALIKDGEIIAAAQEERFSRVKHDFRMPVQAIEYCLKEGNITGKDLDAIVYYDNPYLTLDRFISNAIALGENSKELIDKSFQSMFSSKLWIHEQLHSIVKAEDVKIFVSEHHMSHAASAFYPSPFEEAAIITMDGVGEWATTTLGIGQGNHIELVKEIRYPHSLGLLYSAFTYYCGFKVNSGDYKLMGLAPYGDPVYYEKIRKHIIDIKKDGSYRLNLDYFAYHKNNYMIGSKFEELFNGPRRMPESRITKREMDIAASIQKVVEEVMVLTARHIKQIAGDKIRNLVLAGGVALNCVANGRIAEENIFDNIWIQPAAGDAGGALGAAFYAYYSHFREERKVRYPDSQKGSYLGPEFSNKDVKQYLQKNKYVFSEYQNDEELCERIARELVKNKVIGLFHGRMEYGPRSLGNRSIIANAESEVMQSKLNLNIKFRESFRPFAPSVLEECKKDYFDLELDSPYMLICAPVKEEIRNPFYLGERLKEYKDDLLPVINMKRSSIPAVTHVDFSARIQTVHKETNPFYHQVLEQVRLKSGCGVIVNTSFNVRGEPIVCSPEDAYTCFMRTDMDILVLENCILEKEKQPEFQEDENWRDKYGND